MPLVRRAGRCLVGLLALLSLAGAAAGTEPETLPVPRPAAPTETLPPPRPVPPGPPPWLPRYDLDVQIDVDQHLVRAHQRVTWTNRHQRPAAEVVFNAHSHYKPPEDDIGFLAKMLELVRMMPSEVFEDEKEPPPLQIQRVCLGGKEVEFRFEGDTDTTLVVPLPGAVQQGQSVVLDIDFTLRLPEKQGRWGQWRGLTFLSNWQPVVAVYDEDGWHPTPFIPWHQPFFNEAGLFSVRVTLPAWHMVAASAPAMARKDLGNGLQQVDLAPSCLRDFAILCSPRYREFVEQAGPVRVRCCAFPEHEHYARAMAKTAADAIATYSKWIGPYPYTEFTIAEAFFGWNGNECAGLVMIDERVFGMPELAGGYVEYLIAHETCHQWWYNVIGTNGYCETWMDEAMATFFSNRYLDAKHGPNNNLLKFPAGLEWLPNIGRDAYRSYGLYGTIGRGEACATVQDMKDFGHLANLFSMCYDKGHRIVRMIEDRLGTANFLDFMRIIWCKYQFRILRVKDFQRELEAYTGRSWEQFFKDWLYGKGLSDWCVEKVHLEPLPQPGHSGTPHFQKAGFLAALRCDHDRPYRAVILLHQKAEINEQTVLGISLDDKGKNANWRYQYRIPILPGAAEPYPIDSPPGRVTVLPDKRVQVEVLLPRRPVQIAVDPDQLLVDADPSNNWWKPPVKVRFTPCYTFLDETDLTTAHDRWNVIAGPWLFTAPWMDPWYTRSTMAGVRAGLYRTQHFDGGAYLAYRTDFRDVVAGADGLWDHLLGPHTQFGFSAEQRLYTFQGGNQHADRAAAFGRYVIDYGDSLYLPPFQYIEAFTSYTQNFLPNARQSVPGAERFSQLNGGGLHYHINYLTPYWDAEGGFQVDAVYYGGEADLAKQYGMHEFWAQGSTVKYLPDLSPFVGGVPLLGPALAPPLRWLSDTRLAVRGYGALGLPTRGEFFTLGGGGLLRGFDQAQRQGSIVWVGSAEWRVPLIRDVRWDTCDHILGVRHAYAALFYDVGDAYARNHEVGPIAHSLGAGLRLDAAWFSFLERTILRFDVARAVNANTGWQMWFGVTHPF